MLDAETNERVVRYQQVKTEEEGMALARLEGWNEETIKLHTPGWLPHYRNTAATIISLDRQLTERQGKVIPFPEPPQPPGGIPKRRKPVTKAA